MSDVNTWAWIAAGVIVAVLLPVLKGFVQNAFPSAKAEAVLPAWVKKYGALLLLGALTALVVLAGLKQQDPNVQLEWYSAFLLGFSSDAFLEKLVQKP